MAKGISKYKLSTRLNTQTKGKTYKQLYKALCAQYHPYLTLPRISVKPRKKLCDFTGMPAPYTCPRTSLRYCNLSVYKYLRSLSSEHNEKYYEIKTYGATMLNNRK